MTSGNYLNAYMFGYMFGYIFGYMFRDSFTRFSIPASCCFRVLIPGIVIIIRPASSAGQR